MSKVVTEKGNIHQLAVRFALFLLPDRARLSRQCSVPRLESSLPAGFSGDMVAQALKILSQRVNDVLFMRKYNISVVFFS